MFPFIAKILVKAKIKREALNRKKAFLTWPQIEKIALIIESHENINKSEIDEFIRHTNKYIEVYYLELPSKQATYSDWNCLTKKDQTLLRLPKSVIESAFKQKSFDLVLNTCSEKNLFAISLSNSNAAPLHCNAGNTFNDADLIVKRLENQKLVNYLSNVVIYLKMIKN